MVPQILHRGQTSAEVLFTTMLREKKSRALPRLLPSYCKEQTQKTKLKGSTDQSPQKEIVSIYT